MKRLIITMFALCVFLIGCKTTEITPETAYKAGSSAGLATGYFVKLSTIDDATKDALVSITSELAYVVPTNSQTFTSMWMPLVKNKLSVYCETKKLNDNQTMLVNTTFIVITDALDHLFTKNTKLKNSTDAALSAVNGFCTAFNSIMTPSKIFASKMTYDVDSEMYMYLKVKFAK